MENSNTERPLPHLSSRTPPPTHVCATTELHCPQHLLDSQFSKKMAAKQVIRTRLVTFSVHKSSERLEKYSCAPLGSVLILFSP